EAWIAWCGAILDALKERLKCSVYAQDHILHDLGIDLTVFWHGLLDDRQFGLLLVVGDTETAHPPCFTPLTDGGIVDVTAEHQHALKVPLLFAHGLEFVLERFVDALLFHIRLFCLIGAKSATITTFVALSGHPAFTPIAKARLPQPAISLAPA